MMVEVNVYQKLNRKILIFFICYGVSEGLIVFIVLNFGLTEKVKDRSKQYPHKWQNRVCAVLKSFQEPEVRTDRRADDFDDGGFSENAWPSAFSTTDGLDKLEQGCKRKKKKPSVSYWANHTARSISTRNERNKCGVQLMCVKAEGCRCLPVCVCVHNFACLHLWLWM